MQISPRISSNAYVDRKEVSALTLRGTEIDFPQSSDGFSTAVEMVNPPPRASSRTISPTPSFSSVSPLRLPRNPSYFGQAPVAIADPSSSPVSPGRSPFSGRPRSRQMSMSSRHTREGAAGSSTPGSPSSPLFPGQYSEDSQRDAILDELNRAIGQALDGIQSKDVENKTSSGPPEGSQESPTGSPSPKQANESNSKAQNRVHPQSHRHASVGMPQSSSLPQKGDHHKNTLSEVERTPRADLRPAMGGQRTSSIPSVYAAREPDGWPYLPSHAETHMALDVDKMRALLSRNKPLPQACLLRDDFRACKGAGEKAILYATKINELSVCESGLAIWIMRMKQTEQGKHAQPYRWKPGGSQANIIGHPLASSRSLKRPKSSDAPSFGTYSPSSQGYSPQYSHIMRDDNMSEVPFPLRKGSQDVYRARDITQRTPSIAPSSMIPVGIPYPGVYNSSQTLATNPSPTFGAFPSLPSKQQSSSFAAAALNATTLPSRMGFLGLGRKTSKRVGAASQRQRPGDAGHTNNLSISAPLHPPPSSQTSASSSRQATMLRPSGPRPSNSDTDFGVNSILNINTPISSSSIRSLASLEAVSPSVLPVAMHLPSKVSAVPALPNFDAPIGFDYANAEKLTAMTDILPQAQSHVLAQYLRAAKGDDLVAIGRYLEDERQGKL